ncbi:MAG: hypothetical protein K5644_08200 [Lachnospiraceae bacterium]|nr:hypothetical protein [Lachnospiraceae bacterium]
MREFRANMGTGFTTIIMMLVIVVFTTLGVLALSTARSDDKLSDKNLQFVSEYYEAEGKANAIKAQIIQKKNEGVIPADIAAQIDGVTLHEGNMEYAVKVNDSQVIRVTINVAGVEPKVTNFALYNTSEWNPSQPISVWAG